MDYPITGYIVMTILIVVGVLVHHHRGNETQFIIAGEDEYCAQEWLSLTSLGSTQSVTYE